MKHIKAMAKLNSDRKTFDLHIVEQTHRLERFGRADRAEGKYGVRLFRHGEIVLGSNYDPYFVTQQGTIENWRIPGYTKALVLLKGQSGYSEIHNIPVEYFSGIRDAINAYNEYFKDK